MEFTSPYIDLKPSPSKASRRFIDKDMLMASITDLSAAFNDCDDKKDDSLNYLMSSLRSFVDGEDFPEDLLDDWNDSTISCDLDDESDLNRSVKDLLTSLNELLRSKTTFTLNEGTSLDTEMMRLKRSSRKRDKWQPSFDPLILCDKTPKKAGTADKVQRQKEKLVNVLNDALGEKEEDNCKAPKIKTQLKLKPLNPNRFESASKCDLAPVSRIKRNRNTFRSPLGSKSAPLSPLNDHKSPVRRWDSEHASPVERWDSAPRLSMKRSQSIPGDPEKHDAAPKKPARTLAVAN
jgi:hypothetical protein